MVTLKYAKQAGGGVSPACVADLMHIVMHYDNILEMHDTGVRLYMDLICQINGIIPEIVWIQPFYAAQA